MCIRLFVVLLMLLSSLCLAQYAPQSVFKEGTWHKIGVTQDGLYRLDFNFLKNHGILSGRTNLYTLKIYGNGQGMLPQEISAYRKDDVVELPIWVVDNNSDSLANVGDYIIFYARGPHKLTYNYQTSSFEHQHNLYSDTSYYFISVSPGRSKQIQNLTCNQVQSGTLITQTKHCMYYEPEQVNLIASGRDWYSNKFDANNQLKYSFTFVAKPDPESLVVEGVLAVKPTLPVTTSFVFSLGNNTSFRVPVSGFASCNYCKIASTKSFTFKPERSATVNKTLDIRIAHDKSNDAGAEGYLDYIKISYTAPIAYDNKPFFFRDTDSSSEPRNYSIQNFPPDGVVWYLKSIDSVYEVSRQATFCLSKEFTHPEFVVFKAGEVTQSPFYIGKVANQNLHALSGFKLIIIGPEIFRRSIEKLVQFKNSMGISTAWVTPAQIYNEFSSGMQDITAIRDFLRMMYLRGNLENVLLFGSCSYDYKNRILNNTNLVPVYQSRESLHTVNSYCSDDYYAFFGENEGTWTEGGGDNYLMKIGVGRLPVATQTEAEAVVQKIIQYQNNNVWGRWRNRIVFLSDNGDGNLHLRDAELLSNQIDTTHKTYNITKIYMDAYNLVSSPSGSRVPAMNESFKKNLAQGAMLVNYSGHGGPEQLAQENIIDLEEIKKMKNQILPFFVTATCDFGVYDNPAKTSGGKLLVTQPNGGGIGIITSGRPVYQFSNYRINQAFYQSVFEKDSLQKFQTIGQIFKNTKNRSLQGINNRSYSLLADPSMTLCIPIHDIQLTQINKNAIPSSTGDTLKALSEITLTGEIRHAVSGNRMVNFNGEVFIEIYDKYVLNQTQGNGGSIPTTFRTRSNILHIGRASVTNGLFQSTFMVPKDINYSFGTGKISLYAYDEKQKTDASGHYDRIIIGGSNPNAPKDITPPDIKLYINDTTFQNGGIASNPAWLLAQLSDPSGINLSSAAIGHEITLQMSDNPEQIIILNNFYTTEKNSYKKGWIRYPFSELPEGSYVATVKAWDTYNNSAQQSIAFIIGSNSKVILQKVFNFPNPFTNQTQFQIEHNRAGDNLLITIDIYTPNGQKVQSIKETARVSNSIIQINFDTKKDDMYNLPPGLYVYKCTVYSEQLMSQTEMLQKLVLIR